MASAKDVPGNVQKYENHLLVALANGVITEGEKAQLAKRRAELGISDDKHGELIKKFRSMGMFTVERGMSSVNMSQDKKNDGGILYWGAGHKSMMRMNGKMEIPSNTCASFDLKANKWTKQADIAFNGGRQRSGAGYCVLGQRIVVAGGWASQMMEQMISTIDLFDPKSGKLTKVTDIPGGVGLYEPRVVFYPNDGPNKNLAGSIILTGGRPNDPSDDKLKEALDHVLVYNMAAKKWSKLAAMSSKRASHMMALDVDNNRLVVAGGWPSFKSGKGKNLGKRPMKPLDTAEMLDLSSDSNKWTALPKMKSLRSGAGCCMWMGHFMVAGGQDKDSALNTAEYFNFSRKRWVALPRMFEARAGPFVGVVSDELLVCGGDSVLTGGYTQDTIEMYDEDNMGWTKLEPVSKFYPELKDPSKPKKGLAYDCARADGFGGILNPT